MRKWYSLIDKVYSLPSLKQAYRDVKRNKGSKTAGVDHIDIATYGKSPPCGIFNFEGKPTPII